MPRKTTIEIEDDLLAEAQRVLGTHGLKDTVDEALNRVIQAERRRDLGKQLETGEGLEFGEEILRAARQWRT